MNKGSGPQRRRRALKILVAILTNPTGISPFGPMYRADLCHDHHDYVAQGLRDIERFLLSASQAATDE